MIETKLYWGPRGLLLHPGFKNAMRDPQRKVDLIVFKGDEWAEALDFLLKKKTYDRPFVLVSAGSDLTVPEEFFAEGKSNVSLPDDCLAWFSTNVDLYKYPELTGRIKRLPIGVDYDGKTITTHAFVEGFGWRTLLKPSALVEFPQYPHLQEKQLLSLVSSLPDTYDRKLQVYADFWVNKGYGRSFPNHKNGDSSRTLNRKEVYEIIKHNPLVVLSSYRLNRLEAWRAKSQYMFELSIPGNGMDCFRTYEALTLGIIVITISTVLDPLFEGLPVVIVNSLDEITLENLIKWKDKFKGAFRSGEWREKLTNRYWAEQILAEWRRFSDALGERR